MITSSLGYVFECRKDNAGEVCIRETYNYVKSGDFYRMKLVFAVDVYCDILVPSYVGKGGYFVPLSGAVSSEEDAERFSKSHKAIYSPLKATYMVCTVDGMVNTLTGEWDKGTDVGLYIPMSELPPDSFECTEPSGGCWLACAAVASSGKFNTHVMSEDFVNAYRGSVLKKASDMVCRDRVWYIFRRSGNEVQAHGDEVL